LKHQTTIDWFNKRCKDYTQGHYLRNRQQQKTINDMSALFYKFDRDRNGTLELNEIEDMFQENGVQVDSKEL